MRLPVVLCLSLLAVIAGRSASAQAVISAHAGLVNFTEGTVLLDNQPLVPKAGTFAAIGNGSALRTEKGRAEILLTPGVFLRIDENSAVRMVSNGLDNTRVEFLSGSAILDSNEAQPDDKPVTLTYKEFQIRFSKPGVYRIDSEPAVFETYTGEAEILADGQAPTKIDESRQFFFGIGMETNKYGDGAIDAFSEWARNRAETIVADNRAAEQSTADPTLPDPSILGPLPPVMTPAPPVYPTYSVPAVSAAPMFIDNGFYGPFGPGPNLFPVNPFNVIYVFPRGYRHWYGNNPHHLHGMPPPRSTGVGYPVLTPNRPGAPVLAPNRPGYPRPFPQRPIQISRPMPLPMRSPAPMRSTMPARSMMPARSPMGPVMIAPPRISPSPAARPNVIARPAPATGMRQR